MFIARFALNTKAVYQKVVWLLLVRVVYHLKPKLSSLFGAILFEPSSAFAGGNLNRNVEQSGKLFDQRFGITLFT